MNRSTSALIAVILVLCIFLGWWLFGPKPLVNPLPPLANVSSINALGILGESEFPIPSTYWQDIYDSLQPARQDDNPAKWAILGKLRIKNMDGTEKTVPLFELDEVPGAFAVGDFNEARVYYRGGDSAKLIDVLRAAHSASQ